MDKTIRQNIIDALDWDPSIESAHIGVAVNNGVAILTGHVPNFAQRLTAERITKRIKGVTAIADELEVRYASAPGHTDEEIAGRAVQVLTWDVQIPEGAVKVKVSRGWVTLGGELDWDYQRRAAEADVRKLGGVLGVINEITLKVRASPADVSRRIHEALTRDAELDADHIRVSVADGKVRLEGTVHSWFEREAAEHAAWSAPGVRAVEDHMRIG